MKKWMTVGFIGVVAVVAVMAGIGFMGIRANDSALDEIRGQQGVVVLGISGMT